MADEDSLYEMSADIVGNIRWLQLLIIFLIFLIVSSNTFVLRVLTRFNNATIADKPTSWGVVVQGLFLIGAIGLMQISEFS